MNGDKWMTCRHEVAWDLARGARAIEVAKAGTITSLCDLCGIRVGFSWGEQQPWTNNGYVRVDVTPKA